MARVVKEYAVRRDEILDAGERFTYSHGYEQMSVQNILDELQIAKGTFYHYFDSKQELLEAIVNRMLDRAVELVNPLVDDPELTALEKLQEFSSRLSRWKIGQKTFLLALLRVWYTDQNVLMREKVRTIGAKRFVLILSAIIEQGIREGVLQTSSPDHTAMILLAIVAGSEMPLAEILLAHHPSSEEIEHAVELAQSFNDAIERVLGAPPGSINMMHPEAIKEWLEV